MKKAQTILGIMLLVAGASTVAMAFNPVSTPEIPAGSAGSAIELVSGILLMFRGSRK